MGGKSRKSGGVSKRLIQRLVKDRNKQKQSRLIKSDAGETKKQKDKGFGFD